MTESCSGNSRVELAMLPADIEMVAGVRAIVADWAEKVAHLDPDLTDDLVLMLSELVTNAVVAATKQFPLSSHPCRRICVRVELLPRTLVCSVFDYAKGAPDLNERPGPEAECHRGMWLIVDACHAQVEVRRHVIRGGKTVTATMPRPSDQLLAV
jgi:anti-sigma regulatory factor (Ser/Thr protein kinase)